MWRKKFGRVLFYIVMSLQLMSLVERQIFDFLGYMWLPMLANFFNTIIVILGIFGNYQYHTSYLFIYVMWTLCWIGWNIFIVCFYLELGNLKLNMDLFSFGTRSYSWWLLNGNGCEVPVTDEIPGTYELGNASSSIQTIALPKTKGCLMEYQYIEVLHASIQIIFAFVGVVLGGFLAHYYYSEVDVKRKKAKKSSHMYSIEYSPQRNENGNVPNGNVRGHGTDDDLYSSATLAGRPGTSISNMLEVNGNDPRHGNMTPRRVKRRAYGRSSARSASKAELGKNKSSTNHRNSTRSYQGGMRNKDRAAQNKSSHMNPVNRLIDDQQRLNQKNPTLLPLSSSQFQNDSSTSNDDTRNAMIAAERMYGQINPGFQNSRPNSMVYSINQNDAPDSHQQQVEVAGGSRGAYNSNQDTNNGLAQQNNADYEISRPPSALTSYSNFHGQRRPLPTSQPGQSIPMKSVQAHGNNVSNNRLLQHDVPPSSLGMSINLTQECITQQSNHLQPNVNVDNNASFDDDLPPPPPPLSSSPTAHLIHQVDAPSTTGAEEDTDSVNNSSIVTAQPHRTTHLPVPLERTVAARRSRNEYVNIPTVVQQIHQQNFNRMFERSNPGDSIAHHNERSGNIKMPISSPDSSRSIGGYTNGHGNIEPPPLPPHGFGAKSNNNHNGDISTSQGEVPNYANASTVETQLMPPPLPPHDRRSGQPSSKPYNDQVRSGAIGANVSEPNRINRFSRNSAAAPGLSLYNNEALSNTNSNSTDQLQNYGDTQTLRADDSRLQFRGNALALNNQFHSSGTTNNQANDNPSTSQNKQSAEPMALSARPHRQITIDYDMQNSNSQQYLPHQNRALSSLGSSSTDNQSSVPNSPAKVEPPIQSVRAEQQVAPKLPSSSTVVEGGGIQHRRTGSGSSSRDNYRASLRAKHRREMQEKVLRQQEVQQGNHVSSRNGPSNPNSQSSNRVSGAIKKPNSSSQNHDEDDYGFTKSPEYGTRIPNHSSSPAKNVNLNHQTGLTNGHANIPNTNYKNTNHHMVNGGGQSGNSVAHSGATDQWYLRDSMQPIDAVQHGGNCKCYRCQRKLTAI